MYTLKLFIWLPDTLRIDSVLDQQKQYAVSCMLRK